MAAKRKRGLGFWPINDWCVDCGKKIDPQHDRHYIVWDEKSKDPDHPKWKGAYRRQCAACHDEEHGCAYNRQTSSDAILSETITTE